MYKVFLISDLHIKETGNEALKAALAGLVQQVGKDSVVIITGDVTDNGASKEYTAAKKLLTPVRDACTLLAVPGNHDYGKLGNFYDSAAEKRWGKFCADLGMPRQNFIQGNTNIILLDSCLKSDAPLDFAQGRVGEKQMNRLRDLRYAATKAGQDVIVALHHDPVSSRWVERLQDGDELLRETYGRVKALFFGHTHGPSHSWTCPRGIPTLLRMEGCFVSDCKGQPFVLETA